MPESTFNQSMKIVYTDSNVTIGLWSNFFFTAWKGKANPEITNHIVNMLNDFSLIHKQGVALISVIKRKASMPPSESRKIMAAALKNIKAIASAGILEGEGFRASAVLGFTAGLMLLSKHSYPNKMFKNSRDCSIWLRDIFLKYGHRCDVSANNIEKAIEQFREKV